MGEGWAGPCMVEGWVGALYRDPPVNRMTDRHN